MEKRKSHIFGGKIKCIWDACVRGEATLINLTLRLVRTTFLRVYLVSEFKLTFLHFKQHYTYFHTYFHILFHQHVFQKITNNNSQTTLSNIP